MRKEGKASVLSKGCRVARMAWQWPHAGLAVEGLFDDGEWHSGVIQRCHYTEKNGLQTAEVYEVEVQWHGA